MEAIFSKNKSKAKRPKNTPRENVKNMTITHNMEVKIPNNLKYLFLSKPKLNGKHPRRYDPKTAGLNWVDIGRG